MEVIVANVDDIKFDVELAVEQQIGAQPMIFPGMDKSTAGACTFFLRGNCEKGNNCPFRHIRATTSVVCKHWLRGLCKKGDECEFLHEYDMTKMPECYFYSKFSECGNKDCPFQHIDPEKKVRDCPWYDRGFCRHGPQCKNRHVRRLACPPYMAGFCPEGRKCKHMHPRWELPTQPSGGPMRPSVCFYCNESGHKLQQCDKIDKATLEQLQHQSGFRRPPWQQQHHQNNDSHGDGHGDNQGPPHHHQFQQQLHHHHPGEHHQMHGQPQMGGGPMRPRRNISEITCFKCGLKGHYAAQCDQQQSGGHPMQQQPSGIQAIGTTGGGFRGRRGFRY